MATLQLNLIALRLSNVETQYRAEEAAVLDDSHARVKRLGTTCSIRTLTGSTTYFFKCRTGAVGDMESHRGESELDFLERVESAGRLSSR